MMNTERSYGEKIMAVANLRRNGPWAERIAVELCYLDGVSKANGGRYDRQIEEACDRILSAPVTEDAVLAAEDFLSALRPAAKQYKELFLAHAHIDCNWTWGYQETSVVLADTMRTMLDLMKEFPEFRFSQSQAEFYRLIAETDPELFGEIRERVKEGRWEITASHWVEADKNEPNGESQVRQILYAKRYLSALFDLPLDYFDLDFEPDIFGFNANVPEILSDAGIRYLYHFRARDEGKFIYNYRAPSGKTVLAMRGFTGYSNRVDEMAVLAVPGFCSQNGVTVCPFVYGVGDHGGGPSRVDIRRILKYRQWPLMPEIAFGTFREFFESIAPLADTFEVFEGEQEQIYTGCYSSQAQIKAYNRICEDRLQETEHISSFAMLLAGGESRQPVLREAWRRVLANQFHDVVTGSCAAISKEFAYGMVQDALARIFPVSNYAMRKLASAIDTSSIPFDDEDCSLSEGAGVGWYQSQCMLFRQPAPERGRGSYRIFHFFNTTPYRREELAECMVWDYNVNIFEAEFVNAEGEPIPFLIAAADGYYGGHRYSILQVKVSVPPLGYTTCVLRPKQGGIFDHGGSCEQPALGYHPGKLRSDAQTGHLSVPEWVDMFKDRTINDDPYEMENEFLYVRFDPMTLEITRLTDKRTGKELVTTPTGHFCLIRENARHGMTGWRMGEFMQTENLNREHPVFVSEYTRTGVEAHTDRMGFLPGITEDTKGSLGKGLRDRLCYTLRFGSSGIRAEICLKPGVPMLEYRLTVDWREKPEPGYMIPQLAFLLPLSYTPVRYTGDIPMGLYAREARRQNVPAESFLLAEAGEGQTSLGILSDCKQSFRGSDDCISVALLRSSYDPDEEADIGVHDMGLGIAAAEDALSVKRLSDCFCHPVFYCSGTSHTGSLPLSLSALRVEGEGIRLTALKPAEDGEGIILRLNNLLSSDGTASVTVPTGIGEAFLADSNEVIREKLPLTDGVLHITVPANGILTVRIH